MNQIWNPQDQSLHPKILAYTVGNDHKWDQDVFLPYDLKASKAHAEMLASIGILTKKERDQLLDGLDAIQALWEKGAFVVSAEQEDGHTAIEQYLTEHYGEVGKKIHTARSRNDQSLTMIRLYTLDQLELIKKSVQELGTTWDRWIKDNGAHEMAGTTHMQKAMPTTVGTWQGAFRDALSDLTPVLETTQHRLNQSPLGSGAGYGIPLEIDRPMTAKALGFDRVQTNPIYCQLSRGTFEAQALYAASQIMTLLARWANDLLLFTMSEFGYFSLPKTFCTGSSIMPQKQNYDALELMRAKRAVVQGAFTEIDQISATLHTGYHRDLQLIKAPLVRGLQTTLESLDVANLIAENLKVHPRALKQGLTPELYATEKVYEKVKAGTPFREAYAEVKSEINPSP